jgi:hypothetical protein
MADDTSDDAERFGDPIPEVFRPDDAVARFVVAMSMANNDLDRTLRDIRRAGKDDAVDFVYRVRLSVGHLVEAVDALNAYRAEFQEVRALIKRLPADAQKDLKLVSGVLQKAGPKALERIRHHTFHYPSPSSPSCPTSDKLLETTLAGMDDRGTELHLDGDTKAVTLTFADDAAIGVALGEATDDAVRLRMELARDAALAFVRWASALLVQYGDENGRHLGQPRVTEKPRDEAA